MELRSSHMAVVALAALFWLNESAVAQDQPPAESAPATEAAPATTDETAPDEAVKAEAAESTGAEGKAAEGEAVEGEAAQESPAWRAWPAVWVNSLAVVDQGKAIVGATADGLLMRPADVVFVEVADLSRVQVLYSHPASVWDVVGNENFVASSDYRGNLTILDRASGTPRFVEGVFERWTRALAIAPDGQHLIAGNEAGKLFKIVLATGEVAQTVDLDSQQVYSIDFAPAGDTLAIADGGGHVHLVSWPELTPIRNIELGAEPIWAVAFVADGQHVVAGGADRKLWKTAIAEGAEPLVVAETGDWVTAIGGDPQRQEFVAATMEGELWQMSAGGGTAATIGKMPSGVWDVAMIDPTAIATATRKHAIAAMGRAWQVTFAEEPTASGGDQTANKSE
jgi:hypothetical protein